MKLDFSQLPLTVGIIGSRDFPKCEIVERFVYRLQKDTLVVSGGARGVDSAAENAAWERHACGGVLQPPKVYLPDKNLPIPARFFARNTQIVNHVKLDGGIMVAFMTDPARTGGTQDSLNKCDKYDVPYILFRMTKDGKWHEPVINTTIMMHPKWQNLFQKA